MALKVSAPDGVKVYNVSSGKSLPQWLSESKKRSLRKDENYRRRIELVQDFEFPAACQRIRATPDGQFLFATGIHPPKVKVYELSQLSMKFERHLDAEIVDFEILSEDYAKVAFICMDRSVHFHAKFGSYYKTRVPKMGRALAYAPALADLMIVGSSSEIYRLSLEQGRFLAPLQSHSPAVNACSISPLHGLFGCAGEDGVLECFDLRQKSAVGHIDAAAAAGAPGEELTRLRYDASGLQCAVGTSNGLVALFDLRSPRPMTVKDHMYGERITHISFHSLSSDLGLSARRVISSDRHSVRIWDADSGNTYTTLEPPDGGINDVCVWPDSGLIMMGCDAPRIQSYFIPGLGPAPRWCSFLEGLTEELEESAVPTVYDDYKFITKAELEKLGLQHLVGTALLRAYMHGYFLDNRLYNKARALAEPFAYDAYRQQRIQQKVEEERKSRISVVKKLPKVNARAAARILASQAEAEGEDGDKKRKAKRALPNLMADERFKSMFQDPAFDIDEEAEEYKMLHPNAEGRAKDKQLLAEHFEELREADGSEASDEDDVDDAPERGDSSLDEASDREEHYRERRPAKRARPNKPSEPKMRCRWLSGPPRQHTPAQQAPPGLVGSESSLSRPGEAVAGAVAAAAVDKSDMNVEAALGAGMMMAKAVAGAGAEVVVVGRAVEAGAQVAAAA
ncbi:hypothetical protein WJX72_005625 [[Myrmecia] bisecta]|uniref:Nucleolar protein 10 n=1 Tax=[Myrmecia] bisecta TaxID=41462 RepID=A0AAW1QF84_9CHLO